MPVQFPGLIPHTRWYRKAGAYGFGFPRGRAVARRVGLTYKIKLLYPPRLWPKLPYTLGGQSSRQLIRRTGRFIQDLEAEGLLTGVGHDLTLMARELGRDLRDFRDDCRKIFLTGDVDRAEQLAIKRCKEIFGAEHVNVQAHSGTQANMAVFFSCLELGDTILAMDLACGGHLTHGHPLNFSGKFFKVATYGVNHNSEMLDYDEILTKAKTNNPKLILAGASAYPREIDYEANSEKNCLARGFLRN